MNVARVIPCLDVDAGRVVKGVNFVDLTDAGDPVELAARYDAEGADEIVFLDITASSDKRETIVDAGPAHGRGGLHPLHHRRRDPRGRRRPSPAAGRGRQGLGHHRRGRATPTWWRAIAGEFGAQCVVVAIDARRRPDGTPEVFTHGGRTPTGLDAVAWAEEVDRRGAGEILLTSMDRDGTRDGFDLELTAAVSDAVGVPVIASGGVGTLEHLADGILEGRADAVLAASIFHFGEHTVAEAKAVMAARGITVRPV